MEGLLTPYMGLGALALVVPYLLYSAVVYALEQAYLYRGE